MTAMAMSCRPDLIIFDEPTTALDVTTQVEVLAAMRDIVEQFNTAAIYITHDLAVVAQMAAPHHGAALRQAGRGGADPRDAEAARPGLHPDAVGRAQACTSRKRPATTSLLRIHERRCQLWRPLKVLDNVTVQVPRGRTVAVVGESGSGKSTLARAITGLLPPLAGRNLFQRQAAAARAARSATRTRCAASR